MPVSLARELADIHEDAEDDELGQQCRRIIREHGSQFAHGIVGYLRETFFLDTKSRTRRPEYLTQVDKKKFRAVILPAALMSGHTVPEPGHERREALREEFVAVFKPKGAIKKDAAQAVDQAVEGFYYKLSLHHTKGLVAFDEFLNFISFDKNQLNSITRLIHSRMKTLPNAQKAANGGLGVPLTLFDELSQAQSATTRSIDPGKLQKWCTHVLGLDLTYSEVESVLRIINVSHEYKKVIWEICCPI